MCFCKKLCMFCVSMNFALLSSFFTDAGHEPTFFLQDFFILLWEVWLVVLYIIVLLSYTGGDFTY